MSGTPVGEITTLLHAWSAGDARALEKLTPLVYRELYRAAQRYMAKRAPGHLLQATALVNELYLRLAKVEEFSWNDRSHFFALCAQSMRHILVDYARSEVCLKRGGEVQRVAFDESIGPTRGNGIDLLALDEALSRLTTVDNRKSRVFELRYFSGLSVKETAEVLEVSEDTVVRDWKFVKHWLLSELGGANGKRRRTLAKV